MVNRPAAGSLSVLKSIEIPVTIGWPDEDAFETSRLPPAVTACVPRFQVIVSSML